MIIGILSAKSDVNGLKILIVFILLLLQFSLKSDLKKKYIYFHKHIEPLNLGPNLSFYIFFIGFYWIKIDLILQSSLLTPDFLGILSVQYTLNTLYIIQKIPKSSFKKV